MHKRMWLFVMISIISLWVGTSSGAERLHNERWYQEKYCYGQQEVVLLDRTRVDCVTAHYAIEFGFANKWLSDIGQALHYGRSLKKHPAMFMIVERESDLKYVERAKKLVTDLGITICTNWDKVCIFTSQDKTLQPEIFGR